MNHLCSLTLILFKINSRYQMNYHTISCRIILGIMEATLIVRFIQRYFVVCLSWWDSMLMWKGLSGCSHHFLLIWKDTLTTPVGDNYVGWRQFLNPHPTRTHIPHPTKMPSLFWWGWQSQASGFLVRHGEDRFEEWWLDKEFVGELINEVVWHVQTSRQQLTLSVIRSPTLNDGHQSTKLKMTDLVLGLIFFRKKSNIQSQKSLFHSPPNPTFQPPTPNRFLSSFIHSSPSPH